MTDILDAVRILVIVVFVVFGNIIWYSIKNILSENGYKISWFSGHFGDLIDFSHLIDKTTDIKDKRNYRLLLRGLIIIIILFFATLLSFTIDMKNMPCDRYEDYLKKETSGKIVDKFMDRPNHNFPTLTIELNGETFKDNDLTIEHYNLYDSAKIGDFIRKPKGDSITYIERDGRTIKFIKYRKDFCKN